MTYLCSTYELSNGVSHGPVCVSPKKKAVLPRRTAFFKHNTILLSRPHHYDDHNNKNANNIVAELLHSLTNVYKFWDSHKFSGN